MNASRIISNLKRSSCLTSVALLALAATQPVKANPINGTVVVGIATITAPDPTLLVIDQTTNSAIINWDSFNVGVGETTQFVLPDADSWTLNRVVGSQDPSLIYGAIISNGNLVIVNPDGLFFGAGSTVDVNRLIATTADISNQDFSSGNLTFGIAGNPSASIVNEGNITAADYGLAAFIAPSVRNSGIITARLGTVSLASGNTFTIDPYGDGLIKLAIGDEIAGDVFDVSTGQVVSDLVSNDGTLSADGGVVAMTAATARVAVNSVINNTGVIEARSVGVQGGRIILGGSTAAVKAPDAPVQTVRVSGTLNATGIDELFPVSDSLTGGQIQVTGEAILVTNATIDASGRDGGGTVLIGGDYLGGNATDQQVADYGIVMEDNAVATATLVALNDDVRIAADGIDNGNGGKVVVWSDGITFTAADISARGGLVSGDGGFIETSGLFLDVRKEADASAPNGDVGTWLIDPTDITIADTGATLTDFYNTPVDPSGYLDSLSEFLTNAPYSTNIYYPTGNGSVLAASVIEAALNAGTSVVVTTNGSTGSGSGNITLAANIVKTSGGEAFLLLDATEGSTGISGDGGNIFIENGVSVTSTSNKLWVTFYAPDGDIIGTSVGQFDLNGGGIGFASGGDITFNSSSDMPNIAIIPLPSGTGTVDITFDGDQIGFSYDNSAAIIQTGGIMLDDSTASGELFIDFSSLDLLVENMSVVDQFGRIRSFKIGDFSSIGVVDGQALDGTPEFVIAGALTGGGQALGYFPLFDLPQEIALDPYPAVIFHSNEIHYPDSDFFVNNGWDSYGFSMGIRFGYQDTPAGYAGVLEVSTDFNNTVDLQFATSQAGYDSLLAWYAAYVPTPDPDPTPDPTPEPDPAPIIPAVVLDPSFDLQALIDASLAEDAGQSILPTYLIEGLTWQQQQDLGSYLDGMRTAGDLYSLWQNAVEINELLALFKDAKQAQDFILEHMSLGTGLSDAEELFQKKAGVSIYKSSVSIIAEIFLETAMEGYMQEEFGMDENMAESVTASLLNFATADLSGQLIDQAVILAEAVSATGRAQDQAFNAIYNSLNSALENGRLSFEDAMAQIEISKEVSIDLVDVSSLQNLEVAQKTYIMSALAEIALLERGVRSDNLVSERVASLIAAISINFGMGMSGTNFANVVAEQFGVEAWPMS